MGELRCRTTNEERATEAELVLNSPLARVTPHSARAIGPRPRMCGATGQAKYTEANRQTALATSPNLLSISVPLSTHLRHLQQYTSVPYHRPAELLPSTLPPVELHPEPALHTLSS